MTVQARRLIARADRQLKKGDVTEALISLLEAKVSFYDVSWNIEHLLGICYCLRGSFAEAEQAFDRALKRLPQEDYFNRARIMRGKSVVNLVRGNYAKAAKQLEASHLLLSGSEEAPHEASARLEYFITTSHMGRLHQQQGRVQPARECFAAADIELRGSPHELDNLVWWLKTEKRLAVRYTLGRRALRLAQQRCDHRMLRRQIITSVASPATAARRFGS